MPKVTDADAIKKQIVTAAWDVIATEGIQSASMRRVARAAGCTTGLLTHYFRDKHELVTYAYRLALDRMIADATQRVSRARGIEAQLLAAIEAIEPTGRELKQLTVVMINFWAQAAFSTTYAMHCKQDYRRWRKLISATIRSGIAAGELRARTDVRMLTDQLTLLSDGLSGHRRALIRVLLRTHLHKRS
jgi:TetR/AcrR family transcriptional repressor of bet genes